MKQLNDANRNTIKQDIFKRAGGTDYAFFTLEETYQGEVTHKQAAIEAIKIWGGKNVLNELKKLIHLLKRN